ncbi:MAG: DUF808 family protein, partial [Pseudomonadota bacterium]
AALLEEQRVKGAIKTDFILSAEIMTISLNAIDSEGWVNTAVALAVVAIGITALVYGVVAILVKMDDLGLKLSQDGRTDATRSFGRNLVKAMPGVMKWISIIGTAAMLWVGGSIIIHGLEALGWHWPFDTIKAAAKAVSETLGVAKGFVAWFVTATIDGVIGFALGLALIPIVNKGIVPLVSGLFPEKKVAH